MKIDFARAMQALKKVSQLKLYLLIDAAFPNYSEQRKIELEALRASKENTYEFYISLDEIDQEIFNEFLNKLIDMDIKELEASLQPAPLTDEELAPFAPIELEIVDGKLTLTHESCVIADLSPAGELGEAIQQSFAAMLKEAFNATFAKRISPTTVEHLKFYGSRGEAFRYRQIQSNRVAVQSIYDNAYYITWDPESNDHELIDLNLISKSIQERIVNNYGYTLGPSRKGKLDIREKHKGETNVYIAMYIFLYFENRRDKGAHIPSNAELEEPDTQYV